MKLLVVEDDELLQQGLALALTGEGYVCDCAATAAEANSLLITSQYSMVIWISACRTWTAPRCCGSGAASRSICRC